MKAFRGTLIAAAVLLLVGVAWWFLRPQPVDPDLSDGVRLFAFEKHELVRVEVQRPPSADVDAQDIVLEEVDGQWRIAGTDFVAGRSMVNRVKHQLHDLTSRAVVVDSPDAPELYGLGDNAIQVRLTLRDGREIAFQAGDPNPSGVSYYIRPLPGDTIYTVKKSAVDYYSLTLDEFRERRFAGFDSKDVTRIAAAVAVAANDEHPDVQRSLVIQRVGDREWDMQSPEPMAASDDRVRRLLGRVNALKADRFIELPQGALDGQLAEYGLDQPRLDLTLDFASRDSLRLVVGAEAESENKHQVHAFMRIGDDDTVYVARAGLLDDFAADLAEYRNTRVVRMDADDVVAVDVVLRAEPGEDLAGEAGVRFAADQWVWRDGVPVPGSTPERVARYVAELDVADFVDDAPADLAPFGLADPVARITLRNADDEERILRVGAAGEPLVDPEGRERPRRYVTIEGAAPVYLADERVLNVVHDMVRESNRKKEKDAEKAARQERIPSEALPGAEDAR
ncbi:MAG: DUF4340 domain-containing protein [Alphaproteobacteria bacterium]|nr:DUF4340 domain-containing protein [Alphaproteobacteria bacterium]